MSQPLYSIEILDNNQQPITRLKALVPLDPLGNIIKYTSRLSDSGTARFRVATHDPLLVKYGDILQPWANHVRILRSGVNVWQGYIQDCPQRNKRFIEVKAFTYLEQLKKVLVPHDPVTVDGEDQKAYATGNMTQAIQGLVSAVQANATGLIIKGITNGQIDNPVFPQGFYNGTTDISGQPWAFSDIFTLKFDFVDVHYVLTAFGIYSNSDLELTPDLKLNFIHRLGVDKPELVFEYSQYGMIDDFNTPLDGKNQVNHIVAIASDINDNLLKLDVPSDAASIAKYGKLDGVAAYNDVKNKNALSQRLSEELRLNSTPDTEMRMVLSKRAYPLGQYGLGDTCTFKVKLGPINVNQLRQIIGIEVDVHNTGNEKVILNTNKPRSK